MPMAIKFAQIRWRSRKEKPIQQKIIKGKEKKKENSSNPEEIWED